MNILGIGRDKSQSAYFSGSLTEPEYETKEGQGLATPPPGAGWAWPCQGMVWAPSVSLVAYKKPSDLKTPGGVDVFPEGVPLLRHHQIPRNNTRNSVLAPCWDGEVPPERSPSISTIISIDHPCFPHL